MSKKFIKGISKIENCGVFQEWPKGHIAFGRYNLIYGWNGSGKTTLSRILRSLELGSVDKSLTVNGAAPNIQFQLIDNSVIGNKNLSGIEGNIRVFNSDFVRENINADQAEAEPVYHLGIEQGDALEKLKDLKSKILVKEKECSDLHSTLIAEEKSLKEGLTDKARIVREAIAQTNYDVGKLRPALEKIRNENIDISSFCLDDVQLQSNTDTARGNNDKTKIDEIVLTPRIDVLSVLERVDAVCKESVSKVAIEELDKNLNIREWVHQGHTLHKETDKCLFCSSHIDKGRIELLSNYFNKAYEGVIPPKLIGVGSRMLV